jgi:hypothetical protein
VDKLNFKLVRRNRPLQSPVLNYVDRSEKYSTAGYKSFKNSDSSNRLRTLLQHYIILFRLQASKFLYWGGAGGGVEMILTPFAPS